MESIPAFPRCHGRMAGQAGLNLGFKSFYPAFTLFYTAAEVKKILPPIFVGKIFPMKRFTLYFTHFILLTSLLACSIQKSSHLSEEKLSDSAEQVQDSTPTNYLGDPMWDPSAKDKIIPVVRRIFQDSRGDIWFAGDWVVRYKNDSLEVFDDEDNFRRLVVRAVKEDQEGNMWFGTSGGIMKYDGKSFQNYSEEDGMTGYDVWSMEIDRNGNIWAGTLDGVSRFDGERFTELELPEAEEDSTRGVSSSRIVHSIMEDSKGNMWFGTNGGAYIFDGNSLENLSEEDGLCNKHVNDILEDSKGNIWFATHHQGVCRWDGDSFTHFSEKDGIIGTESWSLYEDSKGHIWFPIEGSGMYRYDGQKMKNFHKEEGLMENAMHSVWEDTEGNLWMGGFMALYRYDGKTFTPIDNNGPW